MLIALVSIFLATALAYFVLILLYWRGWTALTNFTVKDTTIIRLPRISVVVAARNEAENLPALLQSMAAQDYPAILWELILVDDHSEDDTVAIAESFEYDNLHVIKMEGRLSGQINSYKKKALETGIAAASGELIVTTDADCVAKSGWLTSIGSYYATHPGCMIVMPVHMNSEGGWMGIFQQLDFMALQGITGAATYWNIHGMCNGANLAYTRSAFFETGGFSGIDKKASGDDLMLLQKMNKQFGGGISYLKSTAAIVSTSPQKTFKDFLSQRIRWAGKAGNYPDATMLPVLLIVYLFNLLLLLLTLATIVKPTLHISSLPLTLPQLLCSTILIKTLLELFFLYPVAQFFGNTRSLFVFPLLQPLHVCYTVIAGALGLLPSYNWKGRKVR